MYPETETNLGYILVRCGQDTRTIAALLAVTPGTIRHWFNGTHEPCASAVRLLAVLVETDHEMPALLDTLIRECKAPERKRSPRPAAEIEQEKLEKAVAKAQRQQAKQDRLERLRARSRERVKGSRGFGSPVLAVVKPSVWDDAFWFVRTVTQEERDDEVSPAMVDSSAVLNRMSEADEAAYWDALKAYEGRTGRVKPD